MTTHSDEKVPDLLAALQRSLYAAKANRSAEPFPNIGDTCCGTCPGGTCYVDGVTDA